MQNSNISKSIAHRLYRCVLVFLVTGIGVPCQGLSDVMISEIMTENTGENTDVLGRAEPWIEIVNKGSSPVSLQGWALSNNRYNLRKWMFPEYLQLAPEERANVWLSGHHPQSLNDIATANWKASAQSTTSILDFSPQGRHALFSGGASLVTDPARGHAVNFILGSKAALSGPIVLTGDFTVGYWFKTRRSGGWSAVGNSANYYYTIGHANDTAVRLYNPNIQIDLSEAFIADTWQHFTLTRCDNDVQVYRNGVAVGSSSWTSRLEIDRLGGKSANLTWDDFDGCLSNATILTRCLTPEEVSRLYSDAYTGDLHTNFKPSTIDGCVYLVNSSGVAEDEVSSSGIPPGVSRGRNELGGGDWYFFDDPTFSTPNTSESFDELVGYSIDRYPNGKKAAISVHFDDNVIQQFTVARPIMDSFNIRGTFQLISGSLWTDLINEAILAVSIGHEIGAHTVSHTRLLDLTIEMVTSELVDSKQSLEQQITGIGNCQVVSYPFGAADLAVMNVAEQAGFIFGRKVGATPYTSFSPTYTFEEFYGANVSFTVVSTTQANAFGASIDTAIAGKGWHLAMFHGIETSGWEPITGATFSSLMQEIANRANDLWVAPIGEVAKYSRERILAELTLISSDADGWELNFDDGLPDLVFDQPITLRLSIPSGREVLGVQYAGGTTIPYTQNDDEIILTLLPTDQQFSVGLSNPLNGYETWALQEAPQAEASKRAAGASIAEDGFSNLMKFFSGFSLMTVESQPVLEINSKSDLSGVLVSFKNHIRANKMDFTLEQSTDMVNWNPVDEELIQFVEEVGDLSEFEAEGQFGYQFRLSVSDSL